MKNIWLVTWSTVREALARKVIISFLVISAIVIIGLGIIFSLADVDSITTMFKQSGNHSFEEIVSGLELLIVSPIASLGLLLAIFASASFVPVMLEKGNIDLLLSKPVSRPQLLWGKYLGGILVVFLNIAFLILGVWLIISIKFSYWNMPFLWTILVISFTFAVLYSIMVLFGVLTKGSTFGMMIAYFIFLILSPLLQGFHDKFHAFVESDFLKTVLKGLYYAIPKTSELMGKLNLELASGKGIRDAQPIISSFLFLIVMMLLSDYIFRKKDF